VKLSHRVYALGLLLCIGVFWVPVTSPVRANTRPRIAFFMPRNDAFWKQAASFARAVGEDLQLDLDIYPGNNDSKDYIESIKQTLESSKRPDGILFKNFDNSGPKIIRLAEQNKVVSINFDEALSESDAIKMGKPREKYKYWLGQFTCDDEEAGFNLANVLIDQAKAKGLVDRQGRVQIVAIAGNPYEGTSTDRITGLQIALAQRKDALLNEVVAAYWKEPRGQERLREVLHRYPQTSVIWAANDGMPLGASRAARKLGKIPNQDLILGGVGTIAEGMKALIDGDIGASIGGNYMAGGWSIILLYDYLHGLDFATESAVMRLSLHTFNQVNMTSFVARLGYGEWGRVNFSRFSKWENQQLLKYPFGFSVMLQQLKDRVPKP
jgi:ABC-type sugar transport system substrate-binding protein